MTDTTITASQLAQVQTLVQQNNTAGAWQLLASFGDQYAAAAYQVIALPTSTFGQVARNSWAAAGVSADTTAEDFPLVAQQHLENYVSYISSSPVGDGTYNLPTTTQIETSYLNALDKYNITPYAAIDASQATLANNQISVTTDGVFFESVPTPNWYNLLDITSSRIGPTSPLVLADITESGAINQFASTAALTAQTTLAITGLSENALNPFFTTFTQELSSLQIIGAPSVSEQIGGYTLLYNNVTGTGAIYSSAGSGYLYYQNATYAINSFNFRFDSNSGTYQYLDTNNDWIAVAANNGQGAFATIDCTVSPSGSYDVTSVTLNGVFSDVSYVGSAPVSISSNSSAVLDGSTTVNLATGSSVTIVPPAGSASGTLTVDQNGNITDQINGQTSVLEGSGNDLSSFYVAGPLSGQTYSTSSLGVDAIIDQGTGNDLLGTAGTTLIGNTNDTLQGNFCIDGIHCDGVQVDGSNSIVTADADSSFAVDGGSNSINSNGGDTLTLDGNSNTVSDASSTGDTVSASGTNEIFNLTGATISEGANSSANISGNNNTETFDGSGGYFGFTGGAGNVVTNDTAGDSVNVGNNTSTTIDGSGGYFGVCGTDVTVYASNESALTISGASYNIVGSGDNIGNGTNTDASIFGNSNTVGGNSGDSYGVYGQGNTINGGSDQYIVVGNTNNVFDTVNASNDDGSTNSGINLNSGSQANIFGNDNLIGFRSGDVAGVYGGGNSIYGNNGANEYIVVGNTNDDFDYVNVSGDVQGQSSSDGYGTGVVLADNTQANVNGGDNYILENAGDALGAYGGGETVAMGADEVLVVGNTNGDADTVNGTGDQVDQTAANGQTTGIFLNADSQAVVNGSRDGVQLAGSSDTLTAADDNVGIPQGLTNEVIDGSNEVIDIGKNVSVTIDGSDDTVHGATDDDLYFDGTHDLADVSDSTVDFTGTNTDDDVDGSGDKGTDWAGSSSSDGGEDGGDGGYGGYGGYGLSSAPTKSGTNIGLIASYDADLTDQAGAQTAETARLQAEASLSSTSSTYTPVFEGAQWASTTITWSIAGNPNNNGAQLSGVIDSQYVSLIENAFQTWAAVSGLKFQQVTGSTTADIQLGWSTFNSASSGVLGYTGFTSLNGSILAGALISLENPADDPLTTDANGQLAYTGAQAELEQVILHEIGHALGLADDSDPKSIMYAVLNAANRTLDATDIEGIQALYEPTTIAATTASATAAVTTGLSDIASLVSSSPITVASSLISSLTSSALSPFTTEADQLIDAMASFSPTASPATFIPTTLASVASGMTLATAGG